MSDPLNEIRERLAGIDKAQLVDLLANALAGNAALNPLVSTIAAPVCEPAIAGMGLDMEALDFFERRYRIVRPLSAATIKAYRDILRGFSRWVGRPSTIRDLATRINDYFHARSKDVSVQRIKTFRAHLAAILSQAVEDGILATLPKIAKFTPPDHIVMAYLPDELDKLIGATHALGTDGLFVRAAIMLVYDSGCRHRDAMSLTWNNLNEADRLLTWVVHKTQRIQSARLQPETIQVLHALKPKALLDDNRLIPFRRDRWAWMKIWQRLGKAAGVNTRKRGLQAVRRTGASLVAASGKSPSQYLGHAPSSVSLAEKFYMDRRISRPDPVGPKPLTPASTRPDVNEKITHATPVLGLLGQFLEANEDKVHRSVLTLCQSNVAEFFDLTGIERIGDIVADSAKEYASLLHHDGFDNIRVGNKLKSLSMFFTWLVEQCGCGDDDLIACWKSTVRTAEYWKPPAAHPACDEDY